MDKGAFDYVFKFIVIGSAGVGKTALISRFVENQYFDFYNPTIGVDFKIKTIEVSNKKVKLQIWDTAGTEKFKTITNAYYKGSQGVIIVFDTTDKSSFKDADFWMGEAKKYAPENSIRLLVGNKIDMIKERKVSREEALEYAQRNDMIYVEASAKTADNIMDVFKNLSKCIIEKVGISKTIHGQNIIPKEKVEKKCC